MILIFDTSDGLVNQFYDFFNGINFCLKHNINFTFRYCSFRKDDLTHFDPKPIDLLFDLKFLNKYKLYIDYNKIKEKVSNENCYNYSNRYISSQILKSEKILEQLVNFKKDYVILPKFWCIYGFRNIIDYDIFKFINPCNMLVKKYQEIKDKLIGNTKYNFIHYRYEKDFINYFKLSVDSLESLIKKITFKDNSLKIFIATSNIKNLIDLKDPKFKNLIYKNDDELSDLNFEQRAFIDYMFGLNSVECYGHSKSSFSSMINKIKNTNNYYD